MDNPNKQFVCQSLQCFESITLSALVTDEIVGDDATVNLSVAGGASPYSYDWDNSETTEDLTGLSFGTYTVIVIGDGGCEATAFYDIGSQLGIDDLKESNISIYPNPTVENINVEVAGNFQYELVAINGDILIVGTGNDSEVISLVDYACGVYFVQVKTENTATTVKVVKK